MLYKIGDYVRIYRVEDAEGVDSDDMASFIDHVGVVIEADDELVLVRFPGTGDFAGFFAPFGEEIKHVKGDQCFTQMTFGANDLHLVARPLNAITKGNFEEGGL